MKLIGRGLFSRVFESDGKALKHVRPGAQRPPHDFKTELAILNSLKKQHPNIITLLDNYEERDPYDSSDDDLPQQDGCVSTKQQVLVFEFYPFTLEDLAKGFHKAIFPTLIQPGGDTKVNKFPEDRALAITINLASALAYLHKSGVIHRDIKPENVLFSTKTSAPVLIDFGVSWKEGMSEDASDKITDVGTGAWRAPELLFGIKDYDEKIDIWSLGCILAFLLTKNGKPFFTNAVEGGVSDLRLVSDIFEKMGTPSAKSWPEVSDVPAFQSMNFVETHGQGLSQLRGTEKAHKVLEAMFAYSAEKRASAETVIELCEQSLHSI